MQKMIVSPAAQIRDRLNNRVAVPALCRPKNVPELIVVWDDPWSKNYDR